MGQCPPGINLFLVSCILYSHQDLINYFFVFCPNEKSEHILRYILSASRAIVPGPHQKISFVVCPPSLEKNPGDLV